MYIIHTFPWLAGLAYLHLDCDLHTVVDYFALAVLGNCFEFYCPQGMLNCCMAVMYLVVYVVSCVHTWGNLAQLTSYGHHT